MYEIYVQSVSHPFFGEGERDLIVKDGIIVAAIQRWFNPSCVPSARRILSNLIGRPVSKWSKGWRKLVGFAAENAQSWAEDVVTFYGEESVPADDA